MATKEFIHAMNQVDNLDKKVSELIEQVNSLEKKNTPTETVSSLESSVNLKGYKKDRKLINLTLDNIQKRLDNIEASLKDESVIIEDVKPKSYYELLPIQFQIVIILFATLLAGGILYFILNSI